MPTRAGQPAVPLRARSAVARARDTALLPRDQRALNTERATISGLLKPAIAVVSAHVALPALPR